RVASTNGSDRSTATTASGPKRLASSPVSAPGPQPTSRTRPSAAPAKSVNVDASFVEYRPMNRSYASAATSNPTDAIYVRTTADASRSGLACGRTVAARLLHPVAARVVAGRDRASVRVPRGCGSRPRRVGGDRDGDEREEDSRRAHEPLPSRRGHH